MVPTLPPFTPLPLEACRQTPAPWNTPGPLTSRPTQARWQMGLKYMSEPPLCAQVEVFCLKDPSGTWLLACSWDCSKL